LLSQGGILERIGVAKVVRGAAQSSVVARKRWLMVCSGRVDAKVADGAWTPGASAAREIAERKRIPGANLPYLLWNHPSATDPKRLIKGYRALLQTQRHNVVLGVCCRCYLLLLLLLAAMLYDDDHARHQKRPLGSPISTTTFVFQELHKKLDFLTVIS